MANSVRRIRIKNPDLLNTNRTWLDADYTSYTSGSTITVVSNVGMAANDICVIGEMGQEKTEAQPIDSTTGYPTITLSNDLAMSHQKGTPVYKTEFDRVQIDYSLGVSWITLDTVDITWDNAWTVYVHVGGNDNYSYRYRFYNSASSNYSEYSPTVTGAGFNKYQMGRLIQNIRKTIKDPDGTIVNDDELLRFLTAAKDIIRAKRADWWFWLKTDAGTITTVDGKRDYNLDDISENIEYIKNVRYEDDSTSGDEVLYNLRFYGDVEFDQQIVDMNATEDDSLDIYTILEPDQNSTAGYLRVDPVPATTGGGKFHIRYYEPDEDYNDVADATSIPIPSILENYAIFRCEQIMGDENKAKIYKELFFGPADRSKDTQSLSGVALLESMQNNKGRPTGQPRSIKVFRGRMPIGRLYGNRVTTNRDTLVENYFDPR